MINEALTCLAEDINEFFRNRLRENEDRVILSAIVNQDGTVAIEGENKIVLTLVNIEEEPISKNTSISNRSAANNTPPVKINIYILFSAYFAKYDVALHFLDNIISYLQGKNIFNSANTPRLDSSIDKFSVEMVSMGTEKLNNLWATLGAKYMPSVLYKIRMLSFHSSHVKELRPPISSAVDEAS